MVARAVFLGIILLAVFWAVGAFNRLLSLRKQLKNAFAQIEVQLKRRYDLIPNLVETAQAYMQYERSALEAVIAARNQAVAANAKAFGNPSNAIAVQQTAAVEGELSSSLSKLLALSAAYPDLQVNENMKQVTEELASTENRIAFLRQVYNDSVIQYNTSLEQFPGSIIACMFAFKSAESLQVTEASQEHQAVKVVGL